MPPDDFSIQLRLMLMLDAAALARVKKGTTTALEEVERAYQARMKSKDIVGEAQKVEKALKGVQEQAEKTTKAVEGVGRKKKKSATPQGAAEQDKEWAAWKGNTEELAGRTPKVIQVGVELNEKKKQEYLQRVQELYDEAKKLGISNAEALQGILKGEIEGLDATNLEGEIMVAMGRVKRQARTAKAASPLDPAILAEARQLEEEAKRLGGAFTKTFEELRADGYEGIPALERMRHELELMADTQARMGGAQTGINKPMTAQDTAEQEKLWADWKKNTEDLASRTPKVIQVGVELNEQKKREYLQRVQELYDEAKKLGISNAEALQGILKGEIQGLDATNLEGEIMVAMGRVKKQAKQDAARKPAGPIDPAIALEAKKLEDEAAKVGEAFSKSFDTLIQEGYTAEQALARIRSEYKQAGVAGKYMAQVVREGGEAAQETTEKVVSSEEAKQQALRRTAAYIRLEASERTRMAEAATRAAVRIQQASQQMIVLGSALTVGIFAEANRYASSAQKQTAATVEWTKATKDLQKARERVDEVIARESLPIMREIASLATKTAGFVEKNPGLVQAALKAGVILAGIGGIGMLVSKGIRVYADIQYGAAVTMQMAAAKLMKEAAGQQLEAAVIEKGAGGGGVVKGFGQKVIGGVTAMAGTTGGVVGLSAIAGLLSAGLVTALTGVTDKIGSIVEKRFGKFAGSAVTNVGNTLLQMNPITGPMTTSITALKKIFPQLQQLSDKGIGGLIGKLTNLGQAAEETASSVNEAAEALKGSDWEKKAADSYQKWQQEDAQLVKEAAAQRAQVIADTEAKIVEITRNYAAQRVSINAQHNAARTDIITTYQQDLIQMEQDYQTNRAEIIKSGNEDIQKMQEQHKEQLEQLEKEHNERVAELTAARDALGLDKENRQYASDKADLTGDFKKEMAERRKETQQRLQELADQYARERAQRYQKYQQDLLDNEAARQAELKQAQVAHAQELAELQAAKAAQLREIQQNLDAERLRRRETFIAQMRELDALLLGERNLKVNYYNAMLGDVNSFLASWRTQMAAALGGASAGTQPSGSSGTSASTGAATSSGSSTWQALIDTWNKLTGRASGGYVGKGVYKVAENGIREFVLSGATTKIAERAVGGSLTQENLIRALAGMYRQGSQVAYNDYRRLEQPMSKQSKRAYEDTARTVLADLLGVGA